MHNTININDKFLGALSLSVQLEADKIMTTTSLAAGQSGFNAQSTTDDVIAGLDQTGKIILVTGASAGLGVETARVLAAAGAQVIMAGRNLEKLERAAAAIRAQHAAADLIAVEIDLADLDSVRRCAERLLAQFPRLDVLINNAGVMACPLSHTVQGHELQFGTNHLGHFLLTGLLLPLLKAAAAARVVCLSSGGHKYSPVVFDDVNFEHRDYDKWLAYGQAKTANALFAVGLNNLYATQGVVANAVHPGAIVTELGRHLNKDDIKAMLASSSDRPAITYKSIPQGAATSVWAATSPLLEGVGGLYLEDCDIGQPVSEQALELGYKNYALDADIAAQLWQLSEQLVGEQFSS